MRADFIVCLALWLVSVPVGLSPRGLIVDLLEVFAQAGGHQQKTNGEHGDAGDEQHDNKGSNHTLSCW